MLTYHIKIMYLYYNGKFNDHTKYIHIFALFLFIILLIQTSFVHFTEMIFAQMDSFPLQVASNAILSSTMSLKANAGEDQYVEEGQPVILNAEDSVSSNPPIDKYQWFQIEPKSPQVELENSDTSRVSFNAPNLPINQAYVFQLIVTDENVTDMDTVNIYVVDDISAIEGNLQARTFEPEICTDGIDNDFDGRVDSDDDECYYGRNIPIPPNIGQALPQGLPPVQQHQGQVQEQQGQVQEQQRGQVQVPPQ